MSSGPPHTDAVTELLLTQAGEISEPVTVLDDVEGALTRALVERGHTPTVWCDDVRSEALLPTTPLAARTRTPASALAGARTVLWRLPRAVAAVEEYAELIAAVADPGVRVIAAERDKQLTRSMNTALARSFESVTASLGYRKARALLASGPRPVEPTWPRTARVESLAIDVVAHGATFSTNRLDRGTALLASCFDQLPDVATAIDLGCGSGILATLLARREIRVHALDVAWSATDATLLTTEANGVAVDVHRRDGLIGWNQPVDLIATNPPFHVRAAKDTAPTRELFDQASRVLVDGGELWCVYNAHLPYLQWLRPTIGPTQIVARDRAYVVTRSVRKGGRLTSHS
ncbi:MAG: methyltransferase [Micropruina sp.]